MAKPVRLEDLGYRCLGPWPGEKPDRAEHVAKAAGQFGYDVQRRGTEWFIRRQERRQGTVCRSFLSRVAAVTAESWAATKEPAFVDEYLRSPFGLHHQIEGLELSVLIELLQKLGARRLPPHRRIAEFKKALVFASREQLRPVLTFALDIFFQVVPRGRVLVYQTDDLYETLQAFLRGAFTMHNVDVATVKELSNIGFETLKQWQPTSSVLIAEQLLSQLDFAFYPHITGFVGGPFGLHLHFLFDKPHTYRPGVWPKGWLAYPESTASFGEESRPMSEMLGDSSGARLAAAHAKYVFKKAPSLDERVSFEDWVVERENRLAFELVDVSNWVMDVAGREYVDGDSALKHFLTIERIRRHALLNVSQPLSILAKTQAFVIADLFETVVQRNRAGLLVATTPVDAHARLTPFKLLFHRSHAMATLSRCLTSLGGTAGEMLRAAAATIYENLASTLLGSIFVPGVHSQRGVSVRGPKGSWVESEEEFVANAMRAFRNTHHGYLSIGNTPSSAYLSVLSGNVPDSLATLPQLWWYAFIGDPAAFAGVPMPPAGAHLL